MVGSAEATAGAGKVTPEVGKYDRREVKDGIMDARRVTVGVRGPVSMDSVDQRRVGGFCSSNRLVAP